MIYAENLTKDEALIRENEIMTIEGVDCYEKNGVAYLKLETVARGLGFTDNSKDVEYVRWNTVKQYLKDIGFSQEVAKDDFIPENIFYRLAMKAKNETAEKFQAKVADEIIPSIRRTGSYSSGKSKIEQSAFIAKFVTDDLPMDVASRLLMCNILLIGRKCVA